jgi:hypothetical protein
LDAESSCSNTLKRGLASVLERTKKRNASVNDIVKVTITNTTSRRFPSIPELGRRGDLPFGLVKLIYLSPGS